MSRTRKFFNLPWRDKLLFFLALGVSLMAKLLIFLFPLRWYSKYLDKKGKPLKANRKNREIIIGRVKSAVSRSSRYAPWKTKCLVDAVTAKLLLQWYGINSTLYLGVKKNDNKELIAHAWLICDDKFITGRSGHERFTVVSSFA